jgi:hypothetical protein
MQPLAVAGAACTLCAVMGFAVSAVAAYPGPQQLSPDVSCRWLA